MAFPQISTAQSYLIRDTKNRERICGFFPPTETLYLPTYHLGKEQEKKKCEGLSSYLKEMES